MLPACMPLAHHLYDLARAQSLPGCLRPSWQLGSRPAWRSLTHGPHSSAAPACNLQPAAFLRSLLPTSAANTAANTPLVARHAPLPMPTLTPAPASSSADQFWTDLEFWKGPFATNEQDRHGADACTHATAPLGLPPPDRNVGPPAPKLPPSPSCTCPAEWATLLRPRRAPFWLPLHGNDRMDPPPPSLPPCVQAGRQGARRDGRLLPAGQDVLDRVPHLWPGGLRGGLPTFTSVLRFRLFAGLLPAGMLGTAVHQLPPGWLTPAT